MLASIFPVLILALVIRTYFADLLLTDIEGEATRTAAVAQRVIEESDALLQRGAEGVELPSDDVMVWISQVIDQDVNVFDGPSWSRRASAICSRRDCCRRARPTPSIARSCCSGCRASSTRTCFGSTPYLIAAAPVRTGGQERMLTVPAALRQREIEREIDDLDRGVHLAALFFILLGAAIGLSMAERIADPIRRLTRATRRIARGDFDARIAVRSVDELRRLVDAFNSMAAELKAQRAQLERTHRLEAWAEMARQVAHEIKNPLTPIQLSAEHLRRVHADRGEPLGSVLEGCVHAILGQVRLLRQIAAEFSSFASSPTAKRAPADLPELVADVVEPVPRRPGGPHRDAERRRGAAAAGLRRSHARPARARQHRRERAARDARRGRAQRRRVADEDVVVLTVRDTGVGMDEEALARVFEPYFSTKTTGTGLGLPIARRNIELSGGTIEVESQKGQGTTVTVRLPVAPPAASAAASTPDR